MLNLATLLNKMLLLFIVFAAFYAGISHQSDNLCSKVTPGSSAEGLLHTTLDVLSIKSCETTLRLER
ncbi:MAG: hypothetical protein ACI8WB_001196 [Phenylobacterium sp.]|jgi:hypothetical protein